jgi:hypothetical protein
VINRKEPEPQIFISAPGGSLISASRLSAPQHWKKTGRHFSSKKVTSKKGSVGEKVKQATITYSYPIKTKWTTSAKERPTHSSPPRIYKKKLTYET